MSDYTQSTTFADKDALPSGDTNKKILGAEVDTELSAISTAIATKLDSASQVVQKITSGAVSAAASLDITGLSSTYAAYVIKFWGLRPATNDVGLYLRTDSDAGVSFDAGSTDYRYYAIVGESGSAVANSNGGTGAAQILLTGGQGIGDVGGEQADGEITIINPSAGTQTNVFWRIGFVNGDATAQYVYVTGGGRRMATAAVNAIQLLMSSGNITTMSYALYGFKAA